MTTDLAGERRKGRALTLFLIAGALSLVAASPLASKCAPSRPDLASGFRSRTWKTASVTRSASRRDAAPKASYRIERTQPSVWVMRDRGDFPVARLAQLTEA